MTKSEIVHGLLLYRLFFRRLKRAHYQMLVLGYGRGPEFFLNRLEVIATEIRVAYRLARRVAFAHAHFARARARAKAAAGCIQLGQNELLLLVEIVPGEDALEDVFMLVLVQFFRRFV